MDAVRRRRPDACKTFDEEIPAYRSSAPSAATHDVEQDKFGLQLPCRSRPLHPAQEALVRAQLEERLEEEWYHMHAGWPVGTELSPVQSAQHVKYRRAILNSEDWVSSREKPNQRRKNGSWALMGYVEEKRRRNGTLVEVATKHYIAHMRYFVRAVCSHGADEEHVCCPLKMAVADL